MKKNKRIKNPYLRGYIDAICMILLENELPMSVELFERMIRFAMKHHEDDIVEHWQLRKVVEIIRDRDLKKEFIYRHVFLTKEDGSSFFSVYDEDSKATAERIIAEYPFDEKLAQRLETLVYKWNLKSSKKASKTPLPHWSEKILV
jgi:hypothetical protein